MSRISTHGAGTQPVFSAVKDSSKASPTVGVPASMWRVTWIRRMIWRGQKKAMVRISASP